jgi:trehalose 6-phosphate phosphatase
VTDGVAGRRLVADGVLALAGNALRATCWLIVSDFDGTLSPLHMDPWGATIVPLARRALRRLAARPATTVVLLSGRSAPDLAGRVRVGGARYLGNHGMEWGHLQRRAAARRLVTYRRPGFEPYDDEAERLATGVPRLVPEPWLVVERKPPALGLHFRAAPDLPGAAARVAAAVDHLDPDHRFERLAGMRMLELRPPGATTKAQAMTALLEELRPGFAVMLGDDVSDAAAFRAMHATGTSVGTKSLAVGVHARADPVPEVVDAADAILAGPAEAARLLWRLASWPTGSPRLRPGRPG